MQKRSHLFHKLWKLVLLLLVGAPSAWGQLYPGDANNDGIVNHFDILYIGYAYGTTGPIRPEAPVDFTEVSVPLLWTSQFPDSTNFAFADADGNGQIDFNDFLTVSLYYGGKRLNPQPSFLQEGTPGFDPQLRLDTPSAQSFYTEGDSLELDLFLAGPNEDTIQSVNGIAFSLLFDPQVFKSVFLDFDNSWMGEGNELFYFQNQSSNQVETAVTRFGVNPVRGKGKIGKLRAIIEDDIIALLTRDSVHTTLEIRYIKMVDGRFTSIPVAGSATDITILNGALNVSTGEPSLDRLIRVFPNPTSDLLQIQAPVEIQGVEIFNAQGQRLTGWQLQAAYELGISLIHQPPGMVFVKIYTEKGIITRKVVIR